MDIHSLKYKYNKLSILEKLIFIHVAVFVLHQLSVFLLQIPEIRVTRWVGLPGDIKKFLEQPWSIFTYAFFHKDIWHILFNMLILYFAGSSILNLFNERKFLNIYFLGIMAGGLLYIIFYNIFPVFQNIDAILIGSSAGVMATLIFITTYLPNKELRFVFFTLKMWHIGAFFVIRDLVMIPLDNPGGRIAHLGGALLGFVYARQLFKGNDIGEWFAKCMDKFVVFFNSKKRKPLKKVYKNKSAKPRGSSLSNDKEDIHEKIYQQKVDAILDKISKSGYESLSKEEKDFLFQIGKK